MKNFNTYLNKLEENIIGFCILFATALITVNVILRFVFNAGLSWSDELVRYVIITLTFIGCSVCVRTGAHISIDILNMYMSERKIKHLNFLIHIIGMIFLLIITLLSLRMISQNIRHPQLSPALQIPMWVPYLTIPIGFGLSSFRYFQEILNYIKGQKNNETSKNLSEGSGK